MDAIIMYPSQEKHIVRALRFQFFFNIRVDAVPIVQKSLPYCARSGLI